MISCDILLQSRVPLSTKWSSPLYLTFLPCPPKYPIRIPNLVSKLFLWVQLSYSNIPPSCPHNQHNIKQRTLWLLFYQEVTYKMICLIALALIQTNSHQLLCIVKGSLTPLVFYLKPQQDVITSALKQYLSTSPCVISIICSHNLNINKIKGILSVSGQSTHLHSRW